MLNIESNVGVSSGSAVTSTRVPITGGAQVAVAYVECSPIANTAGAVANAGHVTLRDGTSVLWRGYVFFNSTAVNQAQGFIFPIGITFAAVTDLNVLYTAITNASTASVAFGWSG